MGNFYVNVNSWGLSARPREPSNDCPRRTLSKEMCGRTALNFNEDEIRAELARANVNINNVRNEPPWRQTHNVAPTYNQPVIRQLGDRPERNGASQDAAAGDTGASADGRPRSPGTSNNVPNSPKLSSWGKPGDLLLQSMRWGLIPFWTKRAPDYASISRTINCRDDSLLENRGMWNSIKGRHRCVIPVMGYYEWLKKSPKERIPHFTKRADGKIMLLAGLWDSVQYEGSDERIYTYTIITTSSAKSVSFLHDRMPVILEPDSDEFRRWLDPNEAWSMKLASILKPYEGELLCYPVKKEVGKVGEDSPLFIVPLHSPENKSNIANFFSKPGTTAKPKIKDEPISTAKEEDINTESHALGKRKVEEMAHDIEVRDEEATPSKIKISGEETVKMGSPVKTPMRKPTKRAPPTPTKKSPAKKEAASKITNFFAVR